MQLLNLFYEKQLKTIAITEEVDSSKKSVLQKNNWKYCIVCLLICKTLAIIHLFISKKMK